MQAHRTIIIARADRLRIKRRNCKIIIDDFGLKILQMYLVRKLTLVRTYLTEFLICNVSLPSEYRSLFFFLFLGMLSSSDDDADSYSSDGDEGSLVIDAPQQQSQQQTNELNQQQNGHQVDHQLSFTNSNDKERH